MGLFKARRRLKCRRRQYFIFPANLQFFSLHFCKFAFSVHFFSRGKGLSRQAVLNLDPLYEHRMDNPTKSHNRDTDGKCWKCYANNAKCEFLCILFAEVSILYLPSSVSHEIELSFTVSTKPCQTITNLEISTKLQNVTKFRIFWTKFQKFTNFQNVHQNSFF